MRKWKLEQMEPEVTGAPGKNSELNAGSWSPVKTAPGVEDTLKAAAKVERTGQLPKRIVDYKD